MELETAFYIIGIVFMSIMLILIIAVLSAIIVIRNKINHIHDAIDSKVTQVESVADKATIGLKTIKYFLNSK